MATPNLGCTARCHAQPFSGPSAPEEIVMVRPSWRRITLFSATVFLVGAGGLLLQRNASAVPPGIYKCIGNRNHWIIFNRAAPVQATSLGAITVAAGQSTTTSDGRETRALTVVDTLTEGRVEGLGDL